MISKSLPFVYIWTHVLRRFFYNKFMMTSQWHCYTHDHHTMHWFSTIYGSRPPDVELHLPNQTCIKNHSCYKNLVKSKRYRVLSYLQASDVLMYRQTSNISCTKSQNLNVSHLVLQLSLANPLKPCVKSRMKMSLEQRRQAMLQQHLSDQQFYCLLRCALYQRLDSIMYGNIMLISLNDTMLNA